MSGNLTWVAGTNPAGFDPRTIRRLRSPKSPTDQTAVNCDWRGVLAAVDCDALLTTFTPTVSILRNDGVISVGLPDLILIGNPAFNDDATRVSLVLAAGVVGFEYLVSLTVQTARYDIFTRSFIFPVSYR